jgi:hypothetical protein
MVFGSLDTTNWILHRRSHTTVSCISSKHDLACDPRQLRTLQYSSLRAVRRDWAIRRLESRTLFRLCFHKRILVVYEFLLAPILV